MEQNTSVSDIAKGERIVNGLEQLHALLDSKKVVHDRLFNYLKDKGSDSRSPFEGNKTKNFTIRLTEQENDLLKKVAESKGLPVSDLVRSLIYEGLEN